jgi:antigen flippase
MSDESQKQILKATSIIGGAQFLSIVIGIVRTKAVALLLGPYGLGVVGMLQSIIDIVRNATGFGLNYSAVKDVAEADASGSIHKLNETITVLRNLVLWTGLLGTVLTIIFAKPLSIFTFGNSQYTLSVVYLSITLLLSSISGGQIALLQGKREVKLMAKATLYGAIYSTFISVLVYYLFGINGIVPVLIISSIIPLIFSWYYSRKIKFERQEILFKDSLSKGLGMARLGFFIVVTGFMATLTLYVIRIIIVDKMNIEGVGFFQASWMISTTYIGIILNAMLSDFFPRLSAINNDKQASNKLVNDQLEIALVLGTPMILFLIATAGLLVKILYSASFFNTVSILQWQLFGAFFTLISWPLGVLFLAKNKGKFCVLTDGFWSLLFLGIVFFGWEYFGFKVLGIGDSIAIIFKLLLVFFLVNKIGDFKFSHKNVKTIVFYGFLTVLMMLNVLFFEGYIQYLSSFGLIFIVSIKSLITLNNLYNFRDKFRYNRV